jgi:predicted permease
MARHPYFCLAIVAALAAVAIIGIVGLVALGLTGREPGQALVGITAAATGALGGALAASPMSWPPRGQTPPPG